MAQGPTRQFRGGLPGIARTAFRGVGRSRLWNCSLPSDHDLASGAKRVVRLRAGLSQTLAGRAPPDALGGSAGLHVEVRHGAREPDYPALFPTSVARINHP